MIITINSFNKDSNIINQERTHCFGQKPIDLISKVKPILILDEPQNLDSEITKQAISKLKCLFTLRYSATHRNYYNLVYRLTPIDAYHQNLVKQIEVLSIVPDNDFNSAFLRCGRNQVRTRPIKAKMTVNKKTINGFKNSQITVFNGDDLLRKTNNDEYNDFVIIEINARYGYVKFSNGVSIDIIGEEKGGVKRTPFLEYR